MAHLAQFVLGKSVWLTVRRRSLKKPQPRMRLQKRGRESPTDVTHRVEGLEGFLAFWSGAAMMLACVAFMVALLATRGDAHGLEISSSFSTASPLTAFRSVALRGSTPWIWASTPSGSQPLVHCGFPFRFFFVFFDRGFDGVECVSLECTPRVPSFHAF